MSRYGTYLQNIHALAVDGYPLSGFAEGDWLEVKVDGGCVVRKPAADGPQLSFVQGQGGYIMVTLLPTSQALGHLLKLREDVILSPRLFSIALISGVNEIITASECGFGDTPQFYTGGPVMQGRQFIFECGDITLDTSLKVTDAQGNTLSGTGGAFLGNTKDFVGGLVPSPFG